MNPGFAPSGATAVLTGAQKLVLAALVCLPVPVLAASGLALPLPDGVYRAVVELADRTQALAAPFAGDDDFGVAGGATADAAVAFAATTAAPGAPEATVPASATAPAPNLRLSARPSTVRLRAGGARRAAPIERLSSVPNASAPAARTGTVPAGRAREADAPPPPARGASTATADRVRQAVEKTPTTQPKADDPVAPTQPSTPVVDKINEVVEPVVKSEPVKTVVEATKPVVEATKPVVEATKPVVEATKPVVEATKPVVEATKPVVEATKPVTDTVKAVAPLPLGK